MNDESPTVSHEYERISVEEMEQRAQSFLARIRSRRSVREFSTDPIPITVVERCIESAAQAPSGANKQPWTFVLVTDPKIKSSIRTAAEQEEDAFYNGRASERWLDDLKPLNTGPEKPFLDDAPALIVVFAQRHGSQVGDRHYYVSESVGIAVGILLTALNDAGLATLTHTPSPMRFLAEILGRPKGEQAFVLIPVGYPADDCVVPAIDRKALDEVLLVRSGSESPAQDEPSG